MIRVAVCVAWPSEQILIPVELELGSTVIKAVLKSGILDRYPELTLENNVGIFSKKVPLNQVLQEGDRVEIYRPLILTPNELRLSRAKR